MDERKQPDYYKNLQVFRAQHNKKTKKHQNLKDPIRKNLTPQPERRKDKNDAPLLCVVRLLLAIKQVKPIFHYSQKPLTD